MAYLRYIVLCWLFAEVLAVANAGGDCTRWLKFSPHRLSVERSYLSQGPLQFWATLKPHRPRPKKLTLYTLNTYGLTTAQLSTHFNGHYNYWQTTIAEGKSPQDLQRIARSIEEVKADIVFLQEVKSVHVLENFNRHYLNGRYQT
ncbi:MAG: hypothetical protein J6Y94_09270, partial [Bacteriovoracaceae bacterium]|nr:hypothetical protein [Bacteriovoracaceae bacterium]